MSDELNVDDHLLKGDAGHIQGRKLQDYDFKDIARRHIVQDQSRNQHARTLTATVDGGGVMTFADSDGVAHKITVPVGLKVGNKFTHTLRTQTTLMTKISGTWGNLEECAVKVNSCFDRRGSVETSIQKVQRLDEQAVSASLTSNKIIHDHICSCVSVKFSDLLDEKNAWSSKPQPIDQRSPFENALVAAIQQACAPAAPPAPPHQARSPPAARARANLTRSRRTAN